MRNIQPSTQHYVRPITYSSYVHFYQTSGIYTFAAGSDQRYLNFSSILGSAEFTSLGGAFIEYKTVGIQILMSRAIDTAGLAPYPALVVACQPNGITSANPTNSTVVYNDNTMVVPAISTNLHTKSWYFGNGAGFSANIWTDCSNAGSQGALYIGSNVLASASLSNVFDVQIKMICQFRGTK